MIGSELALDSSLHPLEKWYVRILGAPINGLRIRARRVLPQVTNQYRSILDAGCGPGVFTFALARKLPDSTIMGIDIDEEALAKNREVAKKLQLGNCEFENCDIRTLDYDERFDCIISVDNLEHIEDDRDALCRFYRALQPAGELLLHVPGYYRRWLFFGWAVNFEIEGHFRPGYRQEEIVEKISSAGFEVLESYYTYGWFETITNNISYWITGARKKRKPLYAFVFPILLLVSWFGRNSRPAKGAGVFVRARRSV